MKVSNETKVGALTAIAITVLILGFNFLKGKNITDIDHTLYAVFPDVEGLAISGPVFANGFQVGRIADMEEVDQQLSGILVTITLTKNINIPNNSFATMNKSLLGASSVKLQLGDSKTFYKEGDTLTVKLSPDIMTEVKGTLSPAVDNINKTLVALESVIQKLNNVIDPGTQNNLHTIIANLAKSSQSLNEMLNTQTGALAKSLDNVESITGNLKRSNGKIDSTLSNVEKATAQLAEAKIAATIDEMKKTLAQLESTIGKMNDPKGTIGALLNERKLYDEIRQTNRSLTILLDDLKTHPKRYVNVSVFGKKDKSTPLSKPIYDSTSTSNQ